MTCQLASIITTTGGVEFALSDFFNTYHKYSGMGHKRTIARQIAEFALIRNQVTLQNQRAVLFFAKKLLDELAENFDETLVNDFLAEYAEWAAASDDPGEASQVFFTLYNNLV